MTAIQWPDPASVPVVKNKYMTPHGPFDRVTSILKAYGGGTEGLIAWSATQEREAVLDAAREIYSEGALPDTPSEFIDEIRGRLGPARQHQKLLAKAADIGTSIHQMIQWTLRKQMGEPAGPEPVLSDPAQWGFMAWQDWWKEAGLTPVRVEQPVWNSVYRYAGTVDLLAQGPKGLEIVDWKTGKAIYDTYHMQVAAYWEASRQWCEPVRARIVRLPKVESDPMFEVKELGDLRYDYMKDGRRIQGGRMVLGSVLFSNFTCALQLYRTLMDAGR